MHDEPPAERDVGGRIRVKGIYSDEAADAFEREGIRPIFVERRADGDVSFWFGNISDAELRRVCEAIPSGWYALSGKIR